MEPRRRKPDDDAASVAKMRRWGPVDILSAPENRATVAKLGRFMFAVAVCPPGAFFAARDLQRPGAKHRDAIAAVVAVLVLNALIAAYVISAFAEPDERLADAPEKVVRVGIWKERRAE